MKTLLISLLLGFVAALFVTAAGARSMGDAIGMLALIVGGCVFVLSLHFFTLQERHR